VSFHEALQPSFKEYQAQILANAKALAAALSGEGWRLVSGGTDNHLMLIDVFARGITGKVAEKALDRAGITVNKNTIPFDTNPPMVASGIRIGTPALTTRGMKEPEMGEVGRLIARALARIDNETELSDVKRDVRKLCDRFPLYAARLEAYDRALAKA
jgi:glycine hydroxymethyltransferase